MRTRTTRRPNKFVMVGNRWFDKVNGNTYHKTTIIDANSNNTIEESPLTYGYGDQWRQTGYDMLVKKKLAKEVDRFNHDKNRKRIIFVDSGYVSRKKDL